IQPLKRALESRDPNTLRKALQTLQVMARSGAMLGEALVPYYRQILPVLNMFRSQKSMSMSRDDMDYRLGRNIGALIDETLGVLEKHGGEDVSHHREFGGDSDKKLMKK
ncbi:hypothetical protein Pmar_PMAR008498, partial [Perkinsus marinus ATCC 50983]